MAFEFRDRLRDQNLAFWQGKGALKTCLHWDGSTSDINAVSYSSLCRSCKSGGAGLSKGCEFEHFSELTGAEEGSRRSWTCLCFSLPPQSLPEYSGTSSPPVSVFMCWGNKGKTLLNSQSQVGNMFLSFPCSRGNFFFFLNLRKAFVPLLKFQKVFRDEGGKKKLSLLHWRVFFPWASERQETKYNYSFCKKQMLTLSRARSWLHQSGDYEEQHEAYTNNHTHFHTCSVLIPPPKICCKPFCSLPCLFL